jgi:hypothetical protein
MKKLLLLFALGFSMQTSFAQPAGMLNETFNLKYIITNGTYYTPNGETPMLAFYELQNNYVLEAEGINNLLNAAASFNGNSLILNDYGITLNDCNEANCYYEDLYFYEILTTQSLESKTLTFNYNEYYGIKHLSIWDSENNWAYFSTEPPPQPNPLLFQTWYLYRVDEDMGNPIFYNGPNPPQFTVNPDFNYTGIEGCSLISGNFILADDPDYEFLLQAKDYFQDTSNCPPGPVGYALIDLHDNGILHCDISTDSQGIDYLTYSASTVFSYSFRNELILSTPENNLSDLTIFPNPAQNKLIIQSTNNDFASVSISDINGRIINSIKNLTSSEIDVSALNSGMYFITITSSPEGRITKKFIKY